jgi:hypothetical protein
MTSHPHARVRAAGIAVAALLVCATALVVAAPAAVADPAAGPYDGFAAGSVIHVDGVTTADRRAVDAELGVANAAVDSEGLKPLESVYQRRLLPDSAATNHSGGYATILEAGTSLMPPNAQNQLKPFTASGLAPSDKTKEEKVVLNQSVGPLAYADVLRTNAASRWNAASCVIGSPIAEARQHLVRADLVETKDDSKTAGADGFDAPVASLDAFSGGPRRGVADVRSIEQLFKGKGPGLGLYSATATTLAPVTLFGGTPNEFTIEANGPAYLVARADGTDGGAKVTYSAPSLSIIQNGATRTVFPAAPIVVRVPDTGDALAVVKIGTLEPLPGANGLGTKTTSDDGTRAAAVANVVEVTVLDAPGQQVKRGATFALGHMEARAAVPRDGISCPIPVTKVADPDAVRTGQRFATTITVFNPFSCPIADLKLDDAITTRDGARFEIVGSEPAAASSTSGANRDAGAASWNLGTLDPGKSKAVVLTLEAQGDAGHIDDVASASGTLTNCPVSPAEAGADVTGLANATASVSGAATLSVPEAHVLGAQVRRDTLPRTGVEDTAMRVAGASMLLCAMALGVFTRRRRAHLS